MLINFVDQINAINHYTTPPNHNSVIYAIYLDDWVAQWLASRLVDREMKDSTLKAAALQLPSEA